MADELLKSKQKKALFDSIARSPAQEEDSSAQEEDPSVEPIPEGPPVDETPKVEAPKVEAPVAAEAPKEKPTPIDPHLIRNISQIFAGATPTLFGMLTSPSSAERGIAETKAFGAATKPKKLVNVIGPDGKPMLEDVAYAGGMEPYVKPGARGEMAKPEYKTYYDTLTKKPVYGAVDRSGNVTSIGSMENLNQHIKSGRIIPAIETTDFDKIKGPSGEERSAPREKFGTPNQGGRLTTTTTASQYGLSEGDFAKGNDLIKTVSERKSRVDEQNRSIDKAFSLLEAGTKDSIVQAAGVFKTAKIVTEEKISDPERAAVTQEAGFLNRLADQLQTNITGEQRISIINQMKQILTRIRAVNDSSKETLNNDAINMFASASFNEADKANKIKFISSQLKPENIVESNNKKLKREQWDALPKAQKEAILEKNNKKKSNKGMVK